MQAIVQALLLPVAQPLVHLNGGLMLMLHAWLLLLLWQRPSGAVPSVGAECVQEKNKLDQRRDEVHPHQQASLPHDSNVHSTVLRHKATEEKRNGKDLTRARAVRSFASNDFGSKFAAAGSYKTYGRARMLSHDARARARRYSPNYFGTKHSLSPEHVCRPSLASCAFSGRAARERGAGRGTLKMGCSEANCELARALRCGRKVAQGERPHRL